MARNGSGTYNRIAGTPYVYNTVIDQAVVNSEFDDIASALTASIAKDGQTTPTADLPMGTYKHTGVGAATARTHYARAAEVQDGSITHLTSVAGTDTITASAALSMSAYATGQKFSFVSAGANTGAATININSIGAKAITKNGTTALAAGDIPSGAVVEIAYDGTRFQLGHVGLKAGDIGVTVQAYDADTAKTDVAQTFTATQTWSKGADVASANALTLGADGNYFDITGTTAITSIGTKGVGTVVKLHFDAALTLTHHATDLILPGGANYTTEAGDEFEFTEYATGDWRCTGYTKASGQAVVGSGGSTLGTPVASTSGTAIDFTSIPAGTKRIVISFSGVSTNGTSPLTVQIGDSGGIETGSYNGGVCQFGGATANYAGGGFELSTANDAGATWRGHVTLTLENSSSNTWIATSVMTRGDSAVVSVGGGGKVLSATLDRVRVTTVGGANTFDNGEINIIYE